jgi:glycosidase
MDNKIKYDPLLFKCPKGPVEKDTTVTFFLSVDDSCAPNEVLFMVKSDEDADYACVPMQKVQNGYQIEHKFENFGHFWYNFQLIFNGYSLFVNKTYDSFSYVSQDKGEDFFQSVLSKAYTCTDSLQGGLIYQIYVDRFCKKGHVEAREPLIMRHDWGGGIQKNTKDPLVINREVFGGNFAGIVSKLDYLKDLGVTTIYLNPIGMANSSHKYDTADYMRVDPMFGSEAEFKELVDKAKQHGIGIVFDGVYNHTGSDSIYFNRYNRFDTLGAYKSQKSKYHKWYDFIDYPNVYQSWWGIDTLPKVKTDCEEFQDYIAGKNGVLDKFLKLGVKGVRLDVVDEISDDFVKKIAERVLSNGENNVIMGEVWDDAATKIAYSDRKRYFCDHELNSVMNYPVKESILSYIRDKHPTDFVSTIRMLQNNYPKVVMDNLMNFLDTHDTGRLYSDLINIAGGDRKLGTTYLKIASLLSFTVVGVPSIFYGDEYGMENNDGSSRGCFDWKNYKNEIFEWYQQLTKIRKLKVMKDGEMNILYSRNGKLVFERLSKDERVIVLVNMTDTPLQINLQGKYKSFFTNKKRNSFKLEKYKFEVLIEEK